MLHCIYRSQSHNYDINILLSIYFLLQTSLHGHYIYQCYRIENSSQIISQYAHVVVTQATKCDHEYP